MAELRLVFPFPAVAAGLHGHKCAALSSVVPRLPCRGFCEMAGEAPEAIVAYHDRRRVDYAEAGEVEHRLEVEEHVRRLREQVRRDRERDEPARLLSSAQ